MISVGICIPTYQRGEITCESIRKIYEKNKKYFDSGLFHFYISDDNSKDETVEQLVKLNSEIKCITIKKNEINLGFEGNIEQCLRMNEKDYAWLLGDDDTINVDIVEAVNAMHGKPDFVVIGKNKKIEEKVYTDKKETLFNLLYESTWMSGLIYSNEIIKYLDFNRYSKGEFPQTGAIFEYFGNNNSSIQYIYGPNYASILRPGKVSYNDRILEIYAKGWTNLVMGLPLVWDYDTKLEILKLRNKDGHDILSNMILMSLRSQGQFNISELNKYYTYIRLYNKTPYIILILISIMPKNILMFLRKKYAKAKNIPLMERG